MKKIIKILYIIIFIVVLSSCNGQKNIEEDYDISIISTDKISLFKQQNGSITLQKELKRNDNFGFLKEDYFNLKDKMFIKTTVIGKKALLAKINKNTLNIDLKKDDSEPYTFTYYENKIYATTVFTDKFNIIEYDENFKEVNLSLSCSERVCLQMRTAFATRAKNSMVEWVAILECLSHFPINRTLIHPL